MELERNRRAGGKGRGGYGRWRVVHGWLGLLAGLILSVQGITGALLGYEREVRNFLGDGAMAGGERLSPERLVAAARGAIGPGDPAWIIWKASEAEPVWLKWRNPDGRRDSHLLDPVTGNYLAGSTYWHRWYEGVLSVHRTLGSGRPGQILMGLSALTLASLLVSGIVLQVKRSRGAGALLGWRRQRADRGKRGSWRHWHAVLGMWLAPLLLIMALTGPVWSFEAYRTVIGWITLSEPRYGGAPSLAGTAGGQPDPEAVLRAVAERIPPTGAMRLVFPEKADSPARFEWAPENAPYENFRSRLFLDPATGAVIAEEPLEEYTRAESLIRWAYPVHTGFWGGWITQGLHALAALSIPFFTLSGVYLYFARKQNGKKRIHE